MSYMTKGPPTKDQPANSGGRPIGQAPAATQNIASPPLDPNNAFQQTQQQLLTTIQQQIYVQQAAAGQVFGNTQCWPSLPPQQTVSSNVPPLVTSMQLPLPQLQQNQGNTLYPALVQPPPPPPQQQQQPNITISKVLAPPTTSVNDTPAVTTTTNQPSAGNNQTATVPSAQIPVTQPLAPTTTGPVVATQNNTGMQSPTPAKTSQSLTLTATKVSPVANNVPLSPVRPAAPVQLSPGAKGVESPNKGLGVTSSAAKPLSKETVLPPRPITHQNTSSISIVQKTPTKSTLKLATVTPRIKTTPKKSPTTPTAASPQRSPIVPYPVPSNASDRPNAVIKTKVSPVKAPPVVVAATPPPKPAEQKVPTPVTKAPNASPVTNATTTAPSPVRESPVTNNVTVSPPQKKDDNEVKVVPKEPVKPREKKEKTEMPKVPSVAPDNKVAPVPAPALNVGTGKEVAKPSKEVKEPVIPVQKLEKRLTKPKSLQSQTTPVAKTKQPERKAAQTPQTPQTRKEPKPSTSRGTEETPTSARLKRARKGVQPFQSPIPEIENAKKASIINHGASTSKEPAEKLVFFYKNEFLAVRNPDDGFYICQAVSNVTRIGQKVSIRWYNEEDPGSGIYIPDYFDKTEFEAVLTTVELEKAGRSNYKIPESELKRVQHILKVSLDVEKGVATKPELTEKNPDGLDLSLYTSESQLEREVQAEEEVTPKSNEKSTKRAHDDEDDDSDYVALAKTIKTTNKETPQKANKKRKATLPEKAPPAKKAAVVPEKTSARSAKGKAAEPTPTTTTTTKASNSTTSVSRVTTARNTAAKRETSRAAATPSTNTGRPTRASRK